MDIAFDPNDVTLPQIALYAIISFLIVAIISVFLYITCSKRYKLNWFEKNLLETATESQDLGTSHEALLVANAVQYNADKADATSLRSSNRSPVSSVHEAFWVPVKNQQSETFRSASAGDDSAPHTPTSPTGSHASLAISISSSSTIPIVGSDKHVVLAMSPARPKVPSMQAKLDFSKLDASLYDQPKIARNLSVADCTRGAICITITYDPNAGMLTVRLIEANDLQPRQLNGMADPYAKIRLLPDKTNFWQTKIHKRTLNPVFDEDFVFEVRPNAINRRTIEVLLYDFDSYSRHFCIGGTKIDLNDLDLSSKTKIWQDLGLCAEQDAKIELGDVMISMSYLPSAERLTVVLVKARNLKIVDMSRNSSDPYVKLTLIHKGKKIKRRKSGVYRNTTSPVFNEAFTFDIPKDTLKMCAIELLVSHDSLLGSNEVIGRAVIGSDKDLPQANRAIFDDLVRSKNSTTTSQWISLTEPIIPEAK